MVEGVILVGQQFNVGFPRTNGFHSARADRDVSHNEVLGLFYQFIRLLELALQGGSLLPRCGGVSLRENLEVPGVIDFMIGINPNYYLQRLVLPLYSIQCLEHLLGLFDIHLLGGEMSTDEEGVLGFEEAGVFVEVEEIGVFQVEVLLVLVVLHEVRLVLVNNQTVGVASEGVVLAGQVLPSSLCYGFLEEQHIQFLLQNVLLHEGYLRVLVEIRFGMPFLQFRQICLGTVLLQPPHIHIPEQDLKISMVDHVVKVPELIQCCITQLHILKH